MRRFWQAFATYDLKTLRQMYGSDAAVFHPSARQYELGPLTVTRFEREYGDPECRVNFHLGEIYVTLLGENAQAAVATYTFRLHIVNVVTAAGLIDRDVHCGRATQVFAYDAEGHLQIAHEHRSAAAKPGTLLLASVATERQSSTRYQ